VIDWATVELPVPASFRLPSDRVCKVSPDGELLWAVDSALIPEGSWGEKLTLRTPETGKLVVSGNPSKFLQGHNLFGSDDLVSLVVAATLKALRLIQDSFPVGSRYAQTDLMPSDECLATWVAGDFLVARADLTFMFHVGSTADVRSWISVAGDAARMRYKNRVSDRGTLYFGRSEKGKRAKDEAWKLYCKRDELDAHQLPAQLPHRNDLLAYSEGMLRAELTLRRRVLNKFGLLFGRDWSAERVAEIFRLRWELLELSDNVIVPVEVVQALPRHLQAAYLAWQVGMDPEQLYPRTTLYRYRKDILARTGIDILVPAPKSNVIPLRRVLSLTPATIPDFARGTSLLFEPSRAA
jgi:II/X family phage/plasmid replication protein